jgi:hypothetical protein
MWITNTSDGQLDDTWTYVGGQWSQLAITGPSGGRQDAAMAYDPADGYVVLFGGGATRPGACGTCNDTWTFSGGRWSELDAPGPPSRGAASFEWDPALGKMILFGGYGCAAPLTFASCGDTWSFLHGRWTNLSIPGPSARIGPSMRYVPAAGGLVLFGGEDLSGRTLGDSWLFDGGWTQLAAAGPPSRSFATLAGEPTAGGAILFGGGRYDHGPSGGTSGELGDTWLFNGTSWHPVTAAGPAPRTTPAMVYDAADGYDLMFGGLMLCPSENCTIQPGDSLIALGDSWAFSLGRVALALSVSVAPTAVCVLNDRSCAAGTWQAEVNVTVRAAYSIPPSGAASLDDSAMTVLPWGQVRLDRSAPPRALCHTLRPEQETCNSDSVVLTLGNADGFRMNWSSNPYLDSLYVGEAWAVEFGITVAGPPYGSVPVYACTTPTCFATGSDPIVGSYSSVSFRPLSAGPEQNDSLPYANITVDPPRLPLTGSSPPASTTPPPPSGLPIGLPSPVIVPAPVPLPTPVFAPLVSAVPTVSLAAIGAGILSAGLARMALQRRSIAVGQPVGNLVRPKPSAFEAERPADSRIGRFE